MPHLDLSTGRIRYEQHGSGPDLVLLHNGFDSSRTWEQLLPRLSGQYRITVYDRTGYGRSEPSGTPGGDIVTDGARELGELLSALGIPAADLIGHCLGAAIALQYASANPDNVRSIISESCGFFADRDTLRKCDLIYCPWEELPEEIQLKLNFMHGAGRAKSFWTASCGYKGGYVMHEGYDLRPHLKSITSPVLVIAGEDDFLFPPQHTKSGFKALPDAELHLLPGTGHDPHRESLEIFCELTEKFISSRGQIRKNGRH